MDINAMIANAGPANLFGNFAQGAATGAQIGQVRDERRKAKTIADLVANNGTSEDFLNAGLIEQAAQMQAIEEKTSPQYKNKKFWEEERKAADQDTRKFNTDAAEIVGTYSTLENLADAASQGDRGARNAMTVSVGRLMSPGIFTESEASALSGGQNSMQAVLQALSGKGVDVDAIKRYVDPYGETFNTEGLLNVGRSIVASRSTPLLNKYNMAKQRAIRSQIPEDQFNTLFGENEYVPVLEAYSQALANRSSQPAPQPMPTPQPTQAAPQPQTLLRFDAQGNQIQ